MTARAKREVTATEAWRVLSDRAPSKMEAAHLAWKDANAARTSAARVAAEAADLLAAGKVDGAIERMAAQSQVSVDHWGRETRRAMSQALVSL